MRILHTADWHIGKKYKSTHFIEDFQFAFQQILSIIKEQSIDILIISGDIFDTTNPSHEAQSAYFNALFDLRDTPLKHIVITSGNHDSTGFLDAPKDLLNRMNITIIGKATPPEHCWLSFGSEKDFVHIAAVPFLRNSDFPPVDVTSGFSIKDRNLSGLKEYYKSAWEHKPTTPGKYIAMGHFTAGRVTKQSESEQEILIGTLDMATADQFPVFDYFALGHIHKPQTVSSSYNMYYSGSPYPMSFTEKEDRKRVLIFDTQHDSLEPESIPLEHLREFRRISGSVSEIQDRLTEIQQKPAHKVFLELNFEIGLGAYSKQDIRDLISEFNQDTTKHHTYISSFSINKPETEFNQEDDELPDADLNSISPQKVFESILQQQEIPEEEANLLLDKFLSISLSINS